MKTKTFGSSKEIIEVIHYENFIMIDVLSNSSGAYKRENIQSICLTRDEIKELKDFL